MDPNEFRQPVKNAVAKSAAYCCSLCRRSTLSPVEGSLTECHYIGTIAHISAKSENGPRFRRDLTPEKRRAPENALFVCWNCHNVIDDKASEHIYTEEWLIALRTKHHETARMVFNQVVPQDVTVLAGSLETEGEGDVAAVRIRDAAVIFKDNFSSKVSGRGTVTNVEITGTSTGETRQTTFGRSTGDAQSFSMVYSGGMWRCPKCGSLRDPGFTSVVSQGGPIPGGSGMFCKRCGTPMVRE